MTRIGLLALTLAPAALLAQGEGWEREALPLRFAQVSPELGRQWERDWHVRAKRGLEWGYCITAYTVGLTKDGDTVYVATEARRVDGEEVTRTHVAFECADAAGRALPKAHVHLTRDCSASRADIWDAAGRAAPFNLVVCGPGITAGIDPRVYVYASAGRQSAAAPPAVAMRP